MNPNHAYFQNQLQSGCVLSEEEQSALNAHLAACPECRAYAAFDRQLSQMMPAAYPPIRHSEREIREKFNSVRSRFETQHWTARVFQHSLSLAGAGAALLLLVVVVSLLPRMLPNMPAIAPAPARTLAVPPTRTPVVSPTPAARIVEMGQPTPTPTALPDGFSRSVSPNGRYTALAQKGQLWIEDSQGTRIRVGHADRWIYPGGWSPDSQTLLFWEGIQTASDTADGLPLWAVEASTGKTTQLAKATLLNRAYQGWSPDGSALIFTNGGYRSAQVGKWLSLYKVDSGQVTDLVSQDKLVPGQVAWSPDGSTIAFAAVDAAQTGAKYADAQGWDNPAILARRIYLLDYANGATTNMVRRLNTLEYYQDAPRWGQDGRLYYVQVEKDLARIMVVDPADKKASGVGAELPGCQGRLPDPAGYYGQVDWGFLFGGCLSTVQAAEMQGIGTFKAVAQLQNMAYIGSGTRLLALDLTNPATPALLAQSEELPGEVVKVLRLPGDKDRVAASAGRYLALFAADNTSDLSLINQSKLPGPVTALILDYNTRRIYAGGSLNADASKGYVVILDSTPYDRLDLLNTLTLPAPVRSLALGESTLYAAAASQLEAGAQPGVLAIPLVKDGFGEPKTAISGIIVYSMTVTSDGLYIGADRRMLAYTLQDPTRPALAWQLDRASSGEPLPGPILGFALRTDAIYLSGRDAAGKTFRMDVAPPQPVQFNSMVDTASFVSVSYGQMLVAGDRLEIYQVSNSRSLDLIATYPPSRP